MPSDIVLAKNFWGFYLFFVNTTNYYFCLKSANILNKIVDKKVFLIYGIVYFSLFVQNIYSFEIECKYKLFIKIKNSSNKSIDENYKV